MRFDPQPLAWAGADGAPVSHAVSIAKPDRATCGEVVPFARVAQAGGTLAFRADAAVTCGRCLRRLVDMK